MRNPDTAPQARGPVAALIVHALFGGMSLLGVLAAWGGLNVLLDGGDFAPAVIMLVVGTAFAAFGVALWRLVFVSEPRASAYAAHAASRYPHAPWLQNEEWARRTIVDQAGLGLTIFLWVWTVAWWGGLALVLSPDRYRTLDLAQHSWGEIALGLFYVLAGLLVLRLAIRSASDWWRIGGSILHVDTLPGFLGSEFRGRVTTRLPSPTRLRVEVACERVTFKKTISSKGRRKRSWNTETLWSNEQIVEPEHVLRLRNGSATIPVAVPLPEDFHPSERDEDGAGVQWAIYVQAIPCSPRSRLQQRATNYSAQFLIPVYRRS